MTTDINGETLQEPKFMEFLRGCGYEIRDQSKSNNSLTWYIYTNSIYVGNVILDPTNQYCDKGAIAVNYVSSISTSTNGETTISLNPNQLKAAASFEGFLRNQKLPYTRGMPVWPIKEIITFLKKDEGLVNLLEEISNGLKQDTHAE